MRRRSLLILGVLIVLIVLSICVLGGLALSAPADSATMLATKANDAYMPNPAAVNCEQKGFKLELRTSGDGSQVGLCIFPDGTECEEWAYYRGECHPGTPVAEMENRAVERARRVLSKQLNVDANFISVYSIQPIRWPDSCLGIPHSGEVCQLVEVPGFRIILAAGEDHFTYHTDLAGENIRLEIAGTYGG